MSWSSGLVSTCIVLASLVSLPCSAQTEAPSTDKITESTRAENPAVWNEYGLLKVSVSPDGRVTTYRMRDLTGALAAWEWMRSPEARPCDLSAFCDADQTATTVFDDNYVVKFQGKPAKAFVDQTLNALPDRKNTSLPAILTFIPRQGLVPDSARYILGSASLAAFAPELVSAKPGFAEGAEGQIAEYTVGKAAQPVRLGIFYYPTPEMARLDAVKFKHALGANVKRSGVLIAAVYGPATQEQVDSLLSRVQYEAKITWNDVPPPSPIKPMYQLLMNIMYLSIVLSAICLAAGLMYAGMRIYRRRRGTLEADEAMTTLHLTGD